MGQSFFYEASSSDLCEAYWHSMCQLDGFSNQLTSLSNAKIHSLSLSIRSYIPYFDNLTILFASNAREIRSGHHLIEAILQHLVQ
jgi:hypothetical protein